MKSDDVKCYMIAILGNPEFIKTCALRYGNGITEKEKGHEYPVANITNSQLATAIANLEQGLISKTDEFKNKQEDISRKSFW